VVPSRGLPAAFSNAGDFLSSEDAEEIGQIHAGGRVEGVVPLKQQGGTRVSGARPNPKPLKINAVNTGGRRLDFPAKQQKRLWKPANL